MSNQNDSERGRCDRDYDCSMILMAISLKLRSASIILIAQVVGACQSHGFWSLFRDDVAISGGVSGSQSNGNGDLFAFDSKTPLVQSVIARQSAGSTTPIIFGIGFWTSNASYPVKINNGYAVVGDSTEVAASTNLHILEIGG